MQRDMMKFTAQTIVRELKNNDPEELAKYYVGAADRKYQVWERNPLSIPLWSEEVVKQKLAYLHNNPVRAGLCKCPEDYKYSSAQIYMGGEDARVYYTIIFLICNLPARVVRSENKTDNGGETSKICIHLVYYCWNFIIYLMLSKNKIIKLRIYFFVFLISCKSIAQKPIDSPQTIADNFFKEYKHHGIDVAMDTLFSWGDSTIKNAIPSVRDTLKETIRIVGNTYLGYEILTKKNITPSFCFYSYLVKYPSYPIRFVFIFYKSKDKWVPIKFTFDTNLTTEMEEIGRLYFLK